MKLSGFIALFAVLNITNALSLQFMCRTTFGRRRFGSRCNSYLPRCQVSSWSQWTQSPTKLEMYTRCASQARGIQERKRTVTVPGSNCPSLSETRKTNQCLDSTTASAVNALRLYAALGFNFKKPAPVFRRLGWSAHQSRPNPVSSNAKKIAKEAEKLMSQFTGGGGGVVKRSSSQCSCPCASGQAQVQRDLVVVVDSSGSISSTDFNKAKNALDKLLTNQCHFSHSCIGKDITRLALVDYSSHVHVVTNFQTFAYNHATPSKLKSLIQGIPRFGQMTHTGEALQKVKNDIFKLSAGMRSNSKKTILVLTDGKSNGNIKEPGTVSQQIVSHFPGTDIIGLGIGKNVDLTELKSITHHSNALGNILVTGFQNFVDIVEAIIEASGDCKLQASEIFDKR